MRVLIFGGFDPDYARNRVLRLGLARLGVRVAMCRARANGPTPIRLLELVGRYLLAEREDVLLVPEFRHKDVPLARGLSSLSGASLVVDPLVSRYDTKIGDWGASRPGSWQADHNRRVDRAAVRFPDLLLCDTNEHARYFQEQYRVPVDRCVIVPVGFDDTVFQPLPEPTDAPFRVAFFGSYLPLHGIETIVDAARRLQAQDVRMLLVGDGQTFEAVRRARQDGVALEVVSRLEPVALVERLRSAHVILGVFGTTSKASRVVPHKVYQGLALGRAVVTGDTPAVREFFEPGVDLLTVPPGDPEALVSALLRLRNDPALRRRLAARGARTVHQRFNPQEVARRLLVGGIRELGWTVHLP